MMPCTASSNVSYVMFTYSMWKYLTRIHILYVNTFLSLLPARLTPDLLPSQPVDQQRTGIPP